MIVAEQIAVDNTAPNNNYNNNNTAAAAIQTQI